MDSKVFGIDDETGTGAPGFFSYHANSYSLTTYDRDQDGHSGNCSTSYGNQPWWYGSCWDGSYFGHNNGPYWSVQLPIITIMVRFTSEEELVK